MRSRHFPLLAAAAAFLSTAAAARAEICAMDPVPAATLLLPYFELDPALPAGRTTLVSINNASAAAALAHVTLWTDYAVPTLTFDVYLTGYDVQTINLRDLFNGALPRTADLERDPGDHLSNQGRLSEEATFPGCDALPPALPALDAAARLELRRAHSGDRSERYGGCAGANYGDGLLRGYLTVDAVTRCTALHPASPGYFSSGIASDRNVLWGWYAHVDPIGNFAQSETLVHIESCSDPSVGAGAGRCPLPATAPTFYGRYSAIAGKDQREPLPTTFSAPFVNGGAFGGGTELVVWRDTKALPKASCTPPPSWFPLGHVDVVAFDEEENVADLCFPGDVTLPIGPPPSCFPLAAQSIELAGGNGLATDPTPPFAFGWMYLNLNHGVGPLAGAEPGQAWVTALTSATGRYAIGVDAVQLDTACDTKNGGTVLVP
ncbi:MAG TPA: hypothetical protein VF121_05535 [Thermoanaerobaculia bacterium]|nr:hypothetical protein [Thermoanaerobaculia bacterium]